MMFSKFAKRIGLAMGAVLLAAQLGGCVIATESHPRAKESSDAVAGGATFCETTGTGVACGGRAANCQLSGDGRHVACGGLATYCQQSSSGEDVACGAQASFCEKSGDGHKVACGGRAPFCEKSGDGNAVACGGEVRPR